MPKTIVITGAGDGLGRALAKRFAREGEKVILLGRTAAKVEAVAREIGDHALAIGRRVVSGICATGLCSDRRARFQD